MQIMIQEIQALKSKACQKLIFINSINTLNNSHNLPNVFMYIQEGMLKAANEVLQEKVSFASVLLAIYKLNSGFVPFIS